MGSSTKFLRQKKFRQNRDTPIIQKNFDTRTFLKYEGPPTYFFGSETRKVSTEKRDTHLPPIHKIFRYQKFLKHKRVPLRSFSAL